MAMGCERIPSLVFSVVAATLVLVAAAQAGSAVFVVPVSLRDIPREFTHVHTLCYVWPSTLDGRLGGGEVMEEIAGGNYSKDVRIVVRRGDGEPSRSATEYDCSVRLHSFGTDLVLDYWPNERGDGFQGVTSRARNPLPARPGSVNRVSVMGTLTAAASAAIGTTGEPCPCGCNGATSCAENAMRNRFRTLTQDLPVTPSKPRSKQSTNPLSGTNIVVPRTIPGAKTVLTQPGTSAPVEMRTTSLSFVGTGRLTPD